VTFRTLSAAAVAAAVLLAAPPRARAADPEPVPAAEAPAPESVAVPPREPAPGDKAAATSLTQTIDADSGVSIQTLCTNCNNADLSMGGLDNDHVAVTCDGMPVSSGLAQIYLLSVMPATVIDKVAVKKGASEPQLPGGAVGGGIAIDRRHPEPGLVLNASADTGEYGWSGSRLDVAGERGRFGGTLVGSWATSDVIDANGDGNPNLPAFDRYTVDASAEVEVGRKQNLRLAGNLYDESQEEGPAAYDQLAFWIEGVHRYNRENVELERKQADVVYDLELDDGSALRASLVWADRSQDIEETESYSSDFFVDTYLIDERHSAATLSWSRPLGQRTMLRLGGSHGGGDYDIVDINFNQFSLFLPPDEARQFALQEELDEYGAWLEVETALGGRVDLSAGLRYADFQYTDNEHVLVALQPQREPWLDIPLPEGDRWLPRAALTWKPADALSLRFSGGAGFRAPEPIYDEVCCGRRYRNNRGVLPESSESYGVEVTYQPLPRFRLGVSGFLTDFEERVLRMASLSYSYRPTYQNVNVPSARYESLALDTSWEATGWLSLKGSASWTEADNRTPNDAIPVLIDYYSTPVWKEFTTAEVPYTVARRAAVGVQVTPPRGGWSFGVATQYSGPQEIQEFVQDFMTNPDLGFSEVHFDSFVSSEDFWVVNANLSKSFKNGLALYGGMDNIFDYVQADLGDPTHDTNWGPLRGSYAYAGIRYRYD
jgi:outer membrane receptor protein involved in Fe transport